MTQQPSATLDIVQIRYRISYLTWLRMKLWAQSNQVSVSAACEWLLMHALDHQRIPIDPAMLLGLTEGTPEG